MKKGRLSAWSRVAALGLLASLVGATWARANDLDLGSNYNSGSFYTWDGSSPGGGGPISTSYLNGVTLPYVYCVDIPDNVYVPDDYNQTTVTTNGTVVVGPGNPEYNSAQPGSLEAVPNAGVIAWLLTTSYSSTSPSLTTVEQDGLQAAIWTAIYGYGTSSSGFYVTDPSVFAQMQTDLNNTGSNTVTLANAGTAPVSDIYWMSPGNGSGTVYQALVTANVGGATITTPEPSTFAIAGLGAMAFIAFGLRRRGAMVVRE